MAQQTIDIGSSANDGTGDPIRDAFDKCNDNFTELYAGLVGLLDFKGSTDCSANPNYPAASKGDFYVVSVAGKIGGASGTVVEVGDGFFATADNAGGTQASVGSSWTVIQANIVGGTITELDDIPDVNVPSPTDGNALVWDSGSSKWIDAPMPGGGVGGTVPDGGATGQVLTKDSGTDQDTSWQAPTVPGLQLISEQTPSGTGTVTFSSIPATYRDLIVMVRGRGTQVAAATTVLMRFNSDTGGNYDYETISGASSSASVQENLAATSLRFGNIAAASASANIADCAEAVISDYRGTTFQKAVFSRYGVKVGTATSNIGHSTLAGWWRNTAAITQIDVILNSGNFVAGSVVSLYGRM